MDQYIIIYSNNNIYKHNNHYIIQKIDIDSFEFDPQLFYYEISLFLIDKELIKKEKNNEIVFKQYKYFYSQNKYPYKRIVLDYIYNFDIYINLISTIMINHNLLKPIKTLINNLTKKIQSIKLNKIELNKNINITTFDISIFKAMLTTDSFNIKENDKNMKNIFDKFSVTPKKMKILYRGLNNVDIPNNYLEEKYISTSINPNVSIHFSSDSCCFQILYNINVPYVILNDYENEYIIQKKFYYHKIHIDNIEIFRFNTIAKLKVSHYIISVNKLSSSELNPIINKIKFQESLINIYKMNIVHTKSFLEKEYQNFNFIYWDRDEYKKKFKSLNNDEINTMLSWKENSLNINAYNYFNKSLYYSILYKLNHTKPITNITKINGTNQYSINYRYNIDKYNTIILINNIGNIIFNLYPGLFITKIGDYNIVYYPAGIIFDTVNKKQINVYPINVEINKNEIYYGNINGIFDKILQ